MSAGRKPGFVEDGFRSFQILFLDLDHRAQFFAEEHGDRVSRKRREVDVQSAISCKGHFAQGDEESSVRSIVVGEEDSLSIHFLDRIKEASQLLDVIDIRRGIADFFVDLSQGGSTQTIPSFSEVDQQQLAWVFGFLYSGAFSL